MVIKDNEHHCPDIDDDPLLKIIKKNGSWQLRMINPGCVNEVLRNITGCPYCPETFPVEYQNITLSKPFCSHTRENVPRTLSHHPGKVYSVCAECSQTVEVLNTSCKNCCDRECGSLKYPCISCVRNTISENLRMVMDRWNT